MAQEDLVSDLNVDEQTQPPKKIDFSAFDNAVKGTKSESKNIDFSAFDDVVKKKDGGTPSPTELSASLPSQLPKSSVTGGLISYADDGQKAAFVQPTTVTEKLFGNVRPEKQQLDVTPKVRNVEKEIEAEQVGKKITSDAIKNTLKAYKDRLSGDGTYNISDTDPALINQKNDLEKDLKEGNLQVVKSQKTGQYILARKNGALQSISQAYNNVKEKEADDKYVASLSTIDKIKHYDNKAALVKDEYLPSQPSGFGGAFGTLIGENATPLVKMGAMATAAGKVGQYLGLTGTALANAEKFGSFLAFANDAGYGGYANNTEKVYNALRTQNPNGDKIDQMQRAERAGLVGEVSGIATAGAMTGAFAKLSNAAKNVNVQPLVKSLEQLAHHTVKESAIQGGFAAGGSIVSDLGAISQGVKMKPSEVIGGAFEAGKGMVEFVTVMGSAMGIVAGLANVPKYVKAQATGTLAKLDPVLVNDAYKEAEANGALDPGTAEKAMQQINGFKEAQKKVPADLPDENVNAISGIQQKIDKLEAQKKTLAPQFHDRIDAVIDSLRSRSKEIASSDKPLEKEVDDITQQPTNVKIEPAIAEEVTPVVEEVKPKINGEDVVKKWVAGIPDTRFTDEERKAFNTVPMKRMTELRIEFHKNIENTAKELDAIEKEKKDAYYNILKDNELKNAQELSEVYHRSKEKGSNPELVKAVEDLLGKAAKVEEVKPTEVDVVGVFHGTNEDFTEFKTNGLGVHFGTESQAKERGSRLVKADITLKKPFRMDDMGSDFDVARLADELLDAGLVTKEKKSDLQKNGTPEDIKNILKENGYDGIVYKNKNEDKLNPKDSYIVFDKSQIKEVKPTEAKTEVKPNLEEEYNSKSVDELIALKKKLYPNPDIESPMTPEEKLLDKVIAKKFSEKNQEIIAKRKIAAEEVKPTETKEEGGKQFKVNEKEIKIADAERAEAKKLHGLVKNMDAPTDADSIALRYLAEGGKVSQDAINEIAGTVKRARLNTGARELKTSEAKARTYAGGDETLDGLAHRLWENNGQEIPIEDIKQSLMDAINSHNTRLEASKSYLERYSPEYQEQQHWDRIAKEREAEFQAKQADLEKELRNPLDEQIEGEASEEHINNLIKQYEAEFKAENQQLAPEGEGKVTEKVSGREGGEPIEEKGLKKEVKTVQDLFESLPESKIARKNEIEKLINNNFDNIIKQLIDNNKIEKIC